MLEKTRAMVRDWLMMYKAMAHSVLFYFSESWVVTGEILKILTTFHHWMAQRIMGMTERRGAGGEWEYPAVEKAMESTWIHPIRV